MCLQASCPVFKMCIPEHAPTSHVLLVRLQVNGILQKLSQVSRGTGAAEVRGGEDGVAGGWGLPRRDTRGADGVAATHDSLLLGVLPVHGVPPLQVITQAFLRLVGRPAFFGLLC